MRRIGLTYRRGRSYSGEPRHLGDFYHCQQKTKEQAWTFPYLLGKSYSPPK